MSKKTLKSVVTFKSRKQINCLSVSSSYVVFGSLKGFLLIYNRETLTRIFLMTSVDLSRKKVVKAPAINHVLIHPEEQDIVAMNSDNDVNLIRLSKRGSSVNTTEGKVVYRYRSEVKSDISCCCFSSAKLPKLVLFVGYKNGVLCEIDFSRSSIMKGNTRRVIDKGDSEMIQLFFRNDRLLASNRNWTFLINFQNRRIKKIGKTPRDGNFGGCFSEKSDSVIFLSRPNGRVWKVDEKTGNVAYTFKFPLIRRRRLNFQLMYKFVGDLVVTHDGTYWMILDMKDINYVMVRNDFAPIIQNDVHKNECFVLHRLKDESMSLSVIRFEIPRPVMQPRRNSISHLSSPDRSPSPLVSPVLPPELSHPYHNFNQLNSHHHPTYQEDSEEVVARPKRIRKKSVYSNAGSDSTSDHGSVGSKSNKSTRSSRSRKTKKKRAEIAEPTVGPPKEMRERVPVSIEKPKEEKVESVEEKREEEEIEIVVKKPLEKKEEVGEETASEPKEEPKEEVIESEKVEENQDDLIPTKSLETIETSKKEDKKEEQGIDVGIRKDVEDMKKTLEELAFLEIKKEMGPKVEAVEPKKRIERMFMDPAPPEVVPPKVKLTINEPEVPKIEEKNEEPKLALEEEKVKSSPEDSPKDEVTFPNESTASHEVEQKSEPQNKKEKKGEKKVDEDHEKELDLTPKKKKWVGFGNRLLDGIGFFGAFLHQLYSGGVLYFDNVILNFFESKEFSGNTKIFRWEKDYKPKENGENAMFREIQAEVIGKLKSAKFLSKKNSKVFIHECGIWSSGFEMLGSLSDITSGFQVGGLNADHSYLRVIIRNEEGDTIPVTFDRYADTTLIQIYLNNVQDTDKVFRNNAQLEEQKEGQVYIKVPETTLLCFWRLCLCSYYFTKFGEFYLLGMNNCKKYARSLFSLVAEKRIIYVEEESEKRKDVKDILRETICSYEGKMDKVAMKNFDQVANELKKKLNVREEERDAKRDAEKEKKLEEDDEVIEVEGEGEEDAKILVETMAGILAGSALFFSQFPDKEEQKEGAIPEEKIQVAQPKEESKEPEKEVIEEKEPEKVITSPKTEDSDLVESMKEKVDQVNQVKVEGEKKPEEVKEVEEVVKGVGSGVEEVKEVEAVKEEVATEVVEPKKVEPTPTPPVIIKEKKDSQEKKVVKSEVTEKIEAKEAVIPVSSAKKREKDTVLTLEFPKHPKMKRMKMTLVEPKLKSIVEWIQKKVERSKVLHLDSIVGELRDDKDVLRLIQRNDDVLKIEVELEPVFSKQPKKPSTRTEKFPPTPTISVSKPKFDVNPRKFSNPPPKPKREVPRRSSGGLNLIPSKIITNPLSLIKKDSPTIELTGRWDSPLKPTKPSTKHIRSKSGDPSSFLLHESMGIPTGLDNVRSKKKLKKKKKKIRRRKIVEFEEKGSNEFVGRPNSPNPGSPPPKKSKSVISDGGRKSMSLGQRKTRNVHNVPPASASLNLHKKKKEIEKQPQLPKPKVVLPKKSSAVPQRTEKKSVSQPPTREKKRIEPEKKVVAKSKPITKPSTAAELKEDMLKSVLNKIQPGRNPFQKFFDKISVTYKNRKVEVECNRFIQKFLKFIKKSSSEFQIHLSFLSVEKKQELSKILTYWFLFYKNENVEVTGQTKGQKISLETFKDQNLHHVLPYFVPNYQNFFQKCNILKKDKWCQIVLQYEEANGIFANERKMIQELIKSGNLVSSLENLNLIIHKSISRIYEKKKRQMSNPNNRRKKERRRSNLYLCSKYLQRRKEDPEDDEEEDEIPPISLLFRFLPVYFQHIVHNENRKKTSVLMSTIVMKDDYDQHQMKISEKLVNVCIQYYPDVIRPWNVQRHLYKSRTNQKVEQEKGEENEVSSFLGEFNEFGFSVFLNYLIKLYQTKSFTLQDHEYMAYFIRTLLHCKYMTIYQEKTEQKIFSRNFYEKYLVLEKQQIAKLLRTLISLSSNSSTNSKKTSAFFDFKFLEKVFLDERKRKMNNTMFGSNYCLEEFIQLYRLFGKHKKTLMMLLNRQDLGELLSFMESNPMLENWNFLIEKVLEKNKFQYDPEKDEVIPLKTEKKEDKEEFLIHMEHIFGMMCICMGSKYVLEYLEKNSGMCDCLSPSFYRKICNLSSMENDQRKLKHEILEIIDSYLWTQKMKVLPPQIIVLSEMMVRNSNYRKDLYLRNLTETFPILDKVNKNLIVHDLITQSSEYQTPEPESEFGPDGNSEVERIRKIIEEEEEVEDNEGVHRGGSLRLKNEDTSSCFTCHRHWGIEMDMARLKCGVCKLPLLENVGSEICLFKCGHGFHAFCNNVGSCLVCQNKSFQSLL